ncbi:hypothetical protein [Amycolatopsis regifaucium]|nr:hypothetical protein [Amycolatopsis regifaucium]
MIGRIRDEAHRTTGHPKGVADPAELAASATQPDDQGPSNDPRGR